MRESKRDGKRERKDRWYRCSSYVSYIKKFLNLYFFLFKTAKLVRILAKLGTLISRV